MGSPVKPQPEDRYPRWWFDEKLQLQGEESYAGHPNWVPVEKPRPGFRAVYPTPAEDFALPTPEEEGWDLL